MELKNWSLLEKMASYHEVKINPEKPRESRLAVALECDKNGKVPEAIEAMTGIPLPEYNKDQLFLFMANRVTASPEKFYGDFPPVDE